MRSNQYDSEALDRAQNGQSLSNYPAIFEGFMAKGIPEGEIKPRENVFTFNAWRKLGRTVCKRPADVPKGEYGVRVITWISYEDKRTGEAKRRPKTSTVFHVSQTAPLDDPTDTPALQAAPDADPAPVDCGVTS